MSSWRKLDERGGRLVRQIDGQTQQRQVVGFEHGASALLARSWGAGLGFAGGALLGLFEAIAFAFEGDDLGSMQQPIDEGDHAAGIGEDLIPFAEHFVGRQDNGTLLLITTGDHLEEQIGVVCVVGEIADFVNGEQPWAGVAAQPACERGGGVLGGEVVQHFGGEGKAGGVAVQYCLVGEVFEQHGFAQAVGTDEHHVGGFADEGEREQLLDQAAVALGRPGPVEVGDRFEGAQPAVIETAFERATGSLAVFDFNDTSEPRLVE